MLKIDDVEGELVGSNLVLGDILGLGKGARTHYKTAQTREFGAKHLKRQGID